MSVSYNLVQRANPQKREEPAKWYATPSNGEPLTGRALTRAATANTTTAPAEMEASMDLLADIIRQQLLQGHTVKVPNLGSFRLTFRSAGAEDISDFNAATMIRDPRILFTPAKELREAVIGNLSYQNSGVLANGIRYASVSDYRTATGVDSGSGSSGSDDSSSSGSDDSENPLG